MTQQEREVVVDATLPVVQIGMAHTAGLHLYDDLARARIRNDDRGQFDRLALTACDDCLDCLHGSPSGMGRSRS